MKAKEYIKIVEDKRDMIKELMRSLDQMARDEEEREAYNAALREVW